MLRIRSGERTSSETESSRISAAVSSFCGSRAIVTRSPLESSRSGHVAKNLQARYAARSMKRASVAIVAACVTCIACAQKPTSRAFGSASTVAVPAGPPSPQMVDGAPVPSGPSMISFVAEVPEGVETTLYRLPSGVALFEASEKAGSFGSRAVAAHYRRWMPLAARLSAVATSTPCSLAKAVTRNCGSHS